MKFLDVLGGRWVTFKMRHPLADLMDYGGASLLIADKHPAVASSMMLEAALW
ncbi:MAG: hypothetical protein H7224_09655 [Polaromonas sp.]|nr:hypothetical protein [Polaromonas sp.]